MIGKYYILVLSTDMTHVRWLCSYGLNVIEMMINTIIFIIKTCVESAVSGRGKAN